jgi:hypothetical protein
MPTYYARANGNVNAAIWATTPTGTASNLFSSFTNADTLMSNNFNVTVNVNTTVLEVRNDTTGGATAGGFYALTDGTTLTANVINGSSTPTVSYGGSGTASLVGNLQSGTAGAAIVTGTGTLNITGNISAGNSGGGHGITTGGSANVNITGNVTGSLSAAAAVGVYATSPTGTVNITGTVTGGNNGNAAGAQNAGTGTLNIFGTAIGGNGAPGAQNASTGTVYVQRAKGNGFGNGSTGLASTVGFQANQTGINRVLEIEYGDLGQSPTSGPIIISDSTGNQALFFRPALPKKTLVDQTATVSYPAASNVRAGVSYAAGSLVGTCAVPPASAVSLGVAVDNTTGTAILTQANVTTALTAFSDGRLANVATVQSTGQQLADAMSM